MESLSNKEHLGVLTGAPITDLEITLVGGRGSNVHTRSEEHTSELQSR